MIAQLKCYSPWATGRPLICIPVNNSDSLTDIYHGQVVTVIYYELHNGCLKGNRNYIPFTTTWVHPWLSDGVGVSNRSSFIVGFYLCTLARPHLFTIRKNLLNPAAFNWSGCTKPGNCAVMYILGMDFLTDLTEWYFVFHFIMCVVPNVACASELK